MGVTLHAWLFQPDHPNAKAVILLHNLKGTRLRVLPIAVGLLRHGLPACCRTAADMGRAAAN